MSESEIREAIAQQEEHIKRIRSCTFPSEDQPRPGLSHAFEMLSEHGVEYRACSRCGVTETDQDYQKVKEK